MIAYKDYPVFDNPAQTIMPKVQHQPPPPPNAPAVREDGPSYAVPVNRASNPAALAHPPPKLADSIFICGGLSARGKVFLKESHCYSPGKSTFEPIAPLNEARAYGAAVCMNRQIILMGGGSHNQCTSSGAGSLEMPHAALWLLAAVAGSQCTNECDESRDDNPTSNQSGTKKFTDYFAPSGDLWWFTSADCD